MKTLRIAASLATLLLAACDVDVPDLNRPGLESLQNPTPSQVGSLATGLVIGARPGITGRVGVVTELGILGHEALVLTTSEPRFVSELLQSTNLDSGSPNFGGNFWVIPYQNIRNANLLLDALPKVVGLTDTQKESMRGFAKTMMALDLLQVINAHDASGAPIDVNLPLGQVAPIAGKTQVFARIAQLLDEANTHLTNGGTAFPFPLGSGFTGFNTPATFRPFNRALMARVEVYRGNYSNALIALSASFVDPKLPGGTMGAGSTLNTGVYHAFGSGSGDTPNALNTTDIFAHPSVFVDAELQTDGVTKDKRVVNKVKAVSPVSLFNHSSGFAFTLYPNSDSPIAMIRNEELILLRAEANIGLSNLGAAQQDIDFIRTSSGGLAAAPALTAGNALDELLKQKRFSLLFEGGHRWIDLRRYGRLTTTYLPPDQPEDKIHSSFPIPLPEQEARR